MNTKCMCCQDELKDVSDKDKTWYPETGSWSCKHCLDYAYSVVGFPITNKGDNK